MPPSLNAAPRLEIHRFTLGNGLRVVLQPDHSAPLVTVNLWYHVGSKDEKPGRTGFAHLFEHVLFEGSEHVGAHHFAYIQERGGACNGSTWYDRTNYYETLPSSELELALWLESDRMGFLLGGITQEKLDNQRDVVKNERRFRIDNQPYGTWLERGMERLFPAGHPYHWPVIGYMADLDRASLEDVRDFFRTFYVPNNAVLSIVGDLDPDRATELVRRYFEGIPKGPDVPRVDSRLAPPGREQVLVVEDAVPLPRLFALWAIPPFGTPGHYALDFASDLLAAGKSSRLYRHLVHDAQLCKDIAAFTFNTEEAGVFAVAATPRPGVASDDVLAALDADLDALRHTPAPASEMARTLNRIETAFVTRIESTERRADLLSMFTTYFDDPGRIDTEIERYRAVAAEAVCREAAEHLPPGRRVRLLYVPRAEAAPAAAVAPPLDRSRIPAHAGERPFAFPKPVRTTLANGLKLVLSRASKVPSVGVAALVDAGASRDPRGKDGLALLTADLLDEGTRKHASVALAEELDALGASLGPAADLDSLSLDLGVLTRNFPAAWALFADVLTEATFPEREFERLRAEQIAQILEDRSQPGAVADDVLEKLLYGSHPYAHPLTGSEETLAAISREDVAGYAADHLLPARTTLLVVGDIEPEAAERLVAQRLSSWSGGAARLPPLPAPAVSGGKRKAIVLVDRPGSAQSEIRLGNLALDRTHGDWIAAEVMNCIFGGKFTSRINLNLRERHGYTYGARSWFGARRALGPFIIATAVDNDATAPALTELFAEMDKMREAQVTPKELAETTSYLSGLFPMTVETSAELLDRLAEIELYALPDDYFDHYRARLRAVTAADVLRVAQSHVRPEEMTVVVVGDADTVRGSLERMGPLTLLDERGRPRT